ncbi:MAG TPA: family 10 glycosylhydrolase [Chitinophagaceae bacterium]
MNRKLSSFIIFLLITTCLIAQKKHEFRAAWIATVANIDWPSKPTISVDSQRTEYINLLEMHRRNGLNAVIVQIRPATDAFYPSPMEPWSEWLTGKQGKPPANYYDPLQFMIDEAHKRGLEFHAWCNPYRAEFTIGKSSIAPTHITRLHPEWFLTYGDKRYFDPGNKEAQRFVVNVIRDIVRRYDVDAIHFDDYFYPYRIAGKEFPDSLTFSRHGPGFTRDDWRRSNVDSVIVQLAKAIKEENKYCRFGISPFGVWRNKDKDPQGSDSRAGQTNYDDLYADILLWLKKGWIDYVAPQLYWEFTHPNAPYAPLLDWWSKNSYGKHCYIGLGIYRATGNNISAPWKDSTLLPRQIQALQNTPNVQGAIYFSSKSFINNPNGWNDSLQNNYYKFPALIPPMPWIDAKKPAPPVVQKLDNGHWKISASADRSVKSIVLYVFRPGETISEDASTIWMIHSGNEAILKVSDMSGMFGPGSRFAATAVSKTNNESSLVLLQ